MTRYAVAGQITGFENTEVFGHLWNPSTTRALYVVRTDLASKDAVGGGNQHITLHRTTTAGSTPGATVTPDADSAFDRSGAPPSGALLYLGNFNTTPTALTEQFRHPMWQRRAGELEVLFFWGRGIRVPPGTGFGWAAATGTAAMFEVGFTWDEP